MPSLPFDKLNEANYDDWKIQMEALLEEKGLFGVVSGRLVMPTTGPNSKGVRAFLEKQRLARSKLILAIEPSQLPHVRNEQDPFVIWQNLSRIHRARGLGVLLTMRMDFLKMSMPPGSTIASYVASIRHAAYRLEECYQAEEDDSISVSTIISPSIPTRPPIVSDLDKISVLLNGLPPTYQPVIVNITGTPLASLTFEDVVTRLMNEEGRLRNIVSPTTTSSAAFVASDSHDEAHVAMRAPKGKSFKSAPSKNVSKPIICHKCGGVGHIRPHCPTPDSDAANVANSDDDEEQALTAIADETEEEW